MTKPIHTNVKNWPDDARRAFGEISLRLRTAPLMNLNASAAPTVTDDRDSGYSVGSKWRNTSTNTLYELTSDSSGSASWQEIMQPKVLEGTVVFFASARETTVPYAGTIRRVTSVTSDTTLSAIDDVVMVDTTGGAVAVNLPAASSHTGQQYTIKKIDVASNNVTIDGNGSETIDDSMTKVLTSQYESVVIVCDGSEWWIIG